MKKSRKILGLTMSVLLMLALFAGCGNKPAAEDTPDSARRLLNRSALPPPRTAHRKHPPRTAHRKRPPKR
jgi:hypothetical protein